MAQRKTLPSGCIAYQLNREEMSYIQNFEIVMEGCVSCKCELTDAVYYVPILDAWLCEECLKEWSLFSKRYICCDEDTDNEIDKMALFEELCKELNISIEKDILSHRRIC